jgi:hypothetical protein
MGWPRKNDGCRLYRERKDKSFILVITENGANPGGHFDAIANVHADATPSLASTLVSPLYLHDRCRRAKWSDLPEEWQRAFGLWMEEPRMGPNPRTNPWFLAG